MTRVRRSLVFILFFAFGFQPLIAADFSAPARTPAASSEFVSYYLEISDAILQSITDLENGRDNTLKNLEFDKSFQRVKGRLDGLSMKFRFAPPASETPFEKSAWLGLVDVLSKITETSDSAGTSLDTFFGNQDLFELNLNESIRLFTTTVQSAKSRFSANDQEKLRAMLTRYPLAQEGQPYLGAPTYEPQAFVSKKPITIGIAGFQNGTNSTRAIPFAQALISSYFRQSTGAAAFNAKSISFTSTPAEIAAYASDHSLNYMITGKITKFENASWSTGWMGMLASSGYAVHIEGNFNLYDSNGKLLGSATLKAENPSSAQVEDSIWSATAKKFLKDSFGPWIHRLIIF